MTTPARRARPARDAGHGVAYALVPGPAGTAIVASRDGVVVASALPSSDPAAAVARLRARFPAAREASSPREVPGAAAVARWMAGEPRALEGVKVALEGLRPFDAAVYRSLRRVRAGETTTYGRLAADAGSPGGARAVGGAMRRNPLAPFVPCHRVLAAGGAVGGWSGPGGLEGKRSWLSMEAAATLREGSRAAPRGRANP